MRALLLLLLVPLSACATAKAKAPEIRVPLDVPPAPPRVIEPLPSTEPASLEPVAELPPVTATASRPKPAPQREPNRTESPKPEAKPETPTADPAAPAPAAATPPVPPLRTPGSAEGPVATRQALDRAKQMLDSIDARTLNGDRLANYQQAKLYLQQSEEALKNNNIIQAQRLADRAEQIAGKLVGR